jgi:integrase
MREACKIEAEELAKASESSASQRLMLTKLQEANTLAKRGDLSMERAREIVAQMVAASTGKEMRFYTVREWAAEWLAGKQGSTAASSISSYKRFVNGFISFAGAAADKPLDSLDESMIRGFRDSLREQKRLARTCNQAVKILRIWLRAAVAQGFLPRSPAAGVPLLLETDSIERVPFDSAELASILKVTVGAWKGAVMLGIYGGMRLRDAANLRWSAIDGEGGTIRFRPFKTARKKTEIILPLHPALKAYLKTRPLSLDPSGFVFPELAGRVTGGKAGLSYEFIAIMEKAGVKRERARIEADGTRVVDGRRSFHSLRHSFASMLAKGGVSEGLRMELAGHKTPDMARHYTHHELETLRAAVGTLPNFK